VIEWQCSLRTCGKAGQFDESQIVILRLGIWAPVTPDSTWLNDQPRVVAHTISDRRYLLQIVRLQARHCPPVPELLLHPG
jgi:hypothetical protein